jgi:uncharacterized membrane protein
MASIIELLIPFFTVLIVAMLPIVELRAAIPIGIVIYNFHPVIAFAIALFGNLLPVPFIFVLLPYLEKIGRKISQVDKFLNWLYKSTRKKTTKMIERYKYIGIGALVAVPLPVTGAWTGCLISYIFGLNTKKSFVVIVFGVAVAGLLVTLATLGIIWIF